MSSDTQSMCPGAAEPQAEHQWLDQLVGEWTHEGECFMGPDQPPMKSKGTEVVRSIGGLWVVAEGTGDGPDGNPATMLIAIGYDPAKGQFIGNCIASMMTHQWVYDRGELDADRKVLTLHTKGPNFAPGAEGTMADYKDVFEIINHDQRRLTSHMLGEDGKWTQIVTVNHQRVK